MKNATFLLCAFVLAFARVASAAFPAEELVPAPTDPPGVVIDKSTDFQNIYIGSPSIEILPDGTYVASHDFFGPDTNVDLRTQVFESKDRGKTWTKIGAIPSQRASYLFYVKGALYAIGWFPGEGFREAAKNTIKNIIDKTAVVRGRRPTRQRRERFSAVPNRLASFATPPPFSSLTDAFGKKWSDSAISIPTRNRVSG